MSRIGKLPITIPAGVTITVSDDNTVTVKGPKGQLSEKISPRIKVSMDAGILKVERPTDEKEDRSLHGLSRTLINNMVVGTTKGFEKKLEINGTGYRAQKNGNKLVLNVGYSHLLNSKKATALLSKFPLPTVSRFRASTSRKSVRSQQTSARFVSLNPTRARVSSMTMSIFAARKAKQVRNKGRSELQWFQDKTPIRQDKSATFVFVAKSAALLLVPDSTYIAPSAIFTFSSLMMLPV